MSLACGGKVIVTFNPPDDREPVKPVQDRVTEYKNQTESYMRFDSD